jgi:hypothetical protein
MPLYLLTCELTRGREAYAALREALEGHGALQIFESAWLFRSPRSVITLLEEFRGHTRAGDRLLVAQLQDAFAWANPMGDPADV